MTEFKVELHRTFAAPRAKVFQALLDPDLVARWMCPPEVVVTGVEVDARVGGQYRVEHLTASGERHAFECTIREIVPDERLVLDFAFVGPEPGMREETLLTLSLREADDGRTELTLLHERVALVGGLNPQSVDAGWNHVLDKLEALYQEELA